MSLLSGIKRFGGGLLDLAREYGERQYSPDVSPEMQQAAGEFAPLLSRQYDRDYRVARGNAVRKGAKWYEMNDIAASEAQQAHDAGMMQAVQIAEALKQRREKSGRTQAIHDYINTSPDLKDDQKKLLLAMDEEDAAKLLGAQEFPAPNRNKYTTQSVGNGTLSVTNNEDGTTKFIRDPHAPAGLGGIDGGGMSMEARHMNALQYIQTGKVPSFGNSKAAAQLKIQVMNDAAELLAAGGNNAQAVLAKQQALQATKQALGQVEKQGAANQVAERTMLKNFKLAIEASKKVARAGVPVIDEWIQKGRKEVSGDPAVTAFHVALSTALSEFAKIKSGGAASAAQITESAQAEANKLVHPGMTQEQLEAAIAIVIQDAHNQIDSVNSQRAELSVQLSPFGSLEPDASSPPAEETAAEKLERIRKQHGLK